MYYPPPQKASHWKMKLSAKPEPPHKIVRKEIHGQMVDVKVYLPASAIPTIECDGLFPALAEANRFSRDRGRSLERKAYAKKVAESQERDSKGRFGKR